MKSQTFDLVGNNEMLMHNVQLANPMNKIAKEIKAVSSKKKKSDDDYEQMAWLEFRGGLYHNDEVGPYIPGDWVNAMIRDAAKMNRRGQDVKRSLLVMDSEIKLNYSGPREIEAMWKNGMYDQRMVTVTTSKICRTRPRFPKGWTASVTIAYDEEVFNDSDIISFFDIGGKMIGLGDYRPRFGRFDAKVAG